MADLVLAAIHNGTATLTLNRPEKRNALSRHLIAELATAFAEAEANAAVRTIVITGSGPAFCAGMDLDELRGTLTATRDQIWEDAHKLSQFYEQIHLSPKPTVAAVNGAAVAGGAGLMTVCDLAIGVPAVKIGYPEVRRGLVAAMVLPHLLRHVGERAARWLLLTGELIDAHEAVRIGMLNAVVPEHDLLPKAYNWSERIHEGGPSAIAKTKELLRACSHQAIASEALARESAEPRLGEECQMGLRAFFEKQPAPWIMNRKPDSTR